MQLSLHGYIISNKIMRRLEMSYSPCAIKRAFNPIVDHPGFLSVKLKMVWEMNQLIREHGMYSIFNCTT